MLRVTWDGSKQSIQKAISGMATGTDADEATQRQVPLLLFDAIMQTVRMGPCKRGARKDCVYISGRTSKGAPLPLKVRYEVTHGLQRRSPSPGP